MSAERHRVDEAVALVGFLEVDLAAHRGHAEAVAVAADAGDRALEQVALARLVERAEAQRVQRGDRARAHREDVADDAADAGRRALVGLDGAGVVVRLHLEGDRPAVADADDAGVLAGALQHARALVREHAQRLARVLVAAVLAPHERVHVELGHARHAPEDHDDLLVLVELQSELHGELGGEFRRRETRACRGSSARERASWSL